MHWVDRGPKPEGLREIYVKYTPRWVSAYLFDIGRKPPSDAQWRKFSDELGDRFGGICAYCEKFTKGEVEHFRPKSKFPILVYAWSNWLFACGECNHAKLNSWPSGGYVNPCAGSKSEWPEKYFDFETEIESGFVVPKSGLSQDRRYRAQQTIADLRLNEEHNWKARVEWLRLFAAALPDDPRQLTTEDRNKIAYFSSRQVQLSSCIRGWLSKHGYLDDGLI